MSEAHIQCTERCLALEAERDALQTNHDKMTRMHAERTVQRDVYRDKMDAAILRQGQAEAELDALREQMALVGMWLSTVEAHVREARAALKGEIDD